MRPQCNKPSLCLLHHFETPALCRQTLGHVSNQNCLYALRISFSPGYALKIDRGKPSDDLTFIIFKDWMANSLQTNPDCHCDNLLGLTSTHITVSLAGTFFGVQSLKLFWCISLKYDQTVTKQWNRDISLHCINVKYVVFNSHLSVDERQIYFSQCPGGWQ